MSSPREKRKERKESFTETKIKYNIFSENVNHCWNACSNSGQHIDHSFDVFSGVCIPPKKTDNKVKIAFLHDFNAKLKKNLNEYFSQIHEIETETCSLHSIFI